MRKRIINPAQEGLELLRVIDLYVVLALFAKIVRASVDYAYSFMQNLYEVIASELLFKKSLGFQSTMV